jgi:hypothetical protein
MIENLELEIFAFLGRYNLGDENETNWQKRKVSKKLLHDDYNLFHNRSKSDGDISILIMDKAVQFTNTIQPICLPKLNENVFNVNGIVAGYGTHTPNTPASKLPLHVALKTIDLLECYSSNVGASEIVSRRSFCAAGPDGIPCFGNFKTFVYFIQFSQLI